MIGGFISGYGESQAKKNDFEYLYELIYEEEELNVREAFDLDIYYVLKKYYHRPININNINRASIKALSKLPILRDEVIEAIIKHRTKRPFVNLLDLVKLGIVKYDELEILKHFISVKTSEKTEKLPFSLDVINNAVLRHTNGAGDNISFIRGEHLNKITNNREYGMNAIRFEHKLEFEWPSTLEGNVVIQRDAYEANYFDLVKASLLIELPGVLERVYLGGLSVSMGQRIMFSTSTRNASPDAGNVIQYTKSSRLDIQRGTTENYLLGVGYDLALDPIFIGGFVGAYNYDGEVVSSDALKQVPHVRSLKVGQLHDSTNAILQKNQQWEFLAGLHINYQWNPLSYIGIGILYSEFLFPIKPKLDSYFDLYDFYGKRYWATSVHWSFSHKRLSYFGEIAGYIVPDLGHPRHYAFQDVFQDTSQNASQDAFKNNLTYSMYPGGIIGVVYKLKGIIRSQLSFRYYSPYIPDFHNRGFSASQPKGEVGFYLGTDWYVHKRLRWKLYVDVSKPERPGFPNSPSAKFGTKVASYLYKDIKLAFVETLKWTEVNEESNIDSSFKAELSYRHTYFFIRYQGLLKHDHFNSPKGAHGEASIVEMDLFPINWFSLNTRYVIHSGETSFTIGNENISGLFSGNKIVSGKGFLIDVKAQFTLANLIHLGLKYGYAYRINERDNELVETISEEVQAQVRLTY